MSKENSRKTESDRLIRSFAMPPELDAKLQAMAEKEDRSLSWLIVKAIREMIERDEKGGKSS